MTRGEKVCLALLAWTAGGAPAGARVGVSEESAGGGAAADSAPPPATVSGWDEAQGGFVLRSTDGAQKLVIGGFVQARFEGIAWDERDDARDDTLTFQVRRARLLLLGHVFGERNLYQVQIGADAVDAYLRYPETGTGEIRLFDAWLKHVFSEALALKAGRFKVPFSRQNLTSATRLQLPDRAFAIGRSDFDGRDVGAELSGDFRLGLFQYALAVTNGDGSGDRVEDRDDLAVFGRFVVNPTGDYGYAEGDLQDREALATTLGVAVHRSNYARLVPGFDGPDRTEEGSFLRVGIEGGLKGHGASLQGEAFWFDRDPDVGPGEERVSWYLQGGWFLTPGRFEVAARASRVMPDGDANDESAYAVGANLFTRGHRLKWQAAYTYHDGEARDVGDHRFQAQAQIWF